MTGAGPIRVAVAEDSTLLREGLVLLLADAGFDVVGAAPTAEDFLRLVEEARPGLVVVDVRMPPTFTSEGVRAALVVRRQYPGTAVVVLSQYVEQSYAADLFASHPKAVGYLLKDRVADVEQFAATLRRIAAGAMVLDPEVVAQLLARAGTTGRIDALTPREFEVLGLMAEGLTNSAIADRLVVTQGAVEKHVANIFAKLGLAPADTDHRRVLAVLRYLEHEGARR